MKLAPVLIFFLLSAIAVGAGPAPLRAPDMPGTPTPVLCRAGQAGSPDCAAIRARTILDATQAPWRAIGRLNHAGYDRRSHCTATLIAPDIVLTAAHCLFDDRRDVWIPAQALSFLPGYQRGTHLAVGRVDRYVLAPDHDARSNAFDAPRGADWALLVLSEPMGAGIVPLSPLFATAEGLTGAAGTMAGYSAMRPHVLSRAEDCGGVRPAAGGLLVQSCAAMMGDSGAPILLDTPKGPRVAGVLSGMARLSGLSVSVAVPLADVAAPLAALRDGGR